MSGASHSHALRKISVLIIGCLLVVPAHAKYSGGTGEPNAPYQIAATADLIALGETPADYGKHFVLTADIDLDPNLPGRKVFDKAVIAPDAGPAGWDLHGVSFAGVLDGGHHVIRNLRVKGGTCAGLFGFVDERAVIRNLKLLDVDITGEYAGGLAAIHSGTITSCCVSGAVNGFAYVGGLVGASTGGDIASSYSSSTVTGDWTIGGLAGLVSNGTVADCYSIGTVSGSLMVGGLVGEVDPGTIIRSYSAAVVTGDQQVGGLVGDNDNGSISGSFWDIDISGQVASEGGTGKTTAEMQMARTFLDAAWDFGDETANGTQDLWWINEGKDYPKLSWQGVAGIIFLSIPAGTFEMGDHDGVAGGSATPVHTVTLDGFQMSKYETTNDQYAAYLNAAMADGLIQVVNGMVYASSDANLVQPYCDTYASSPYSQIEYGRGRFGVRVRNGMPMSCHPMARLTWYGAKAFCDYYGCRLPTEAEWEYAAHGGRHGSYYRFPWDDNSIDCGKANCKIDGVFCNPLNLTSWPYTTAVGYYGPQGAYGLCDMSGNLWEWCQDWYDAGYYGVSPANNPTGPTTGTFRVLRGGAWDVDGKSCDIVGRCVGDPLVRGHVTGFRVCR